MSEIETENESGNDVGFELEPRPRVETDTEIEPELGTTTGTAIEQAPFDPDVTGYFPTIQEPPSAGAADAADAADERLARMQQIQLAFIDDPRKAALEAQDLLEDVLRSLAGELARQRDALTNPPPDGDSDTERMRLAVRRSRQLIDTLTNV